MKAVLQKLTKGWRRSRLEKGEKGLCFMHIGKCGGSSIVEALITSSGSDWSGYVNKPQWRQAIRQVLPTDGFYEFENALAAAVAGEAYQKMKAGHRFVFGHFHYSMAFQDFAERYHFVTMLRDPADRVLSGYRYGVLGGNIPYQPAADADQQFLKYLHANAGQHACHSFINFFGGLPLCADYASRLSFAKANTVHFQVVGCLSNTEQFAADVAQLTGRLVKVPFRNRTSDRGRENGSFSELLKWEPSAATLVELEDAVRLDRQCSGAFLLENRR